MVNGSLQSPQRQARLSSWPVLDDELAAGPVDGAGVVPLDAGPEDAEDGAAGPGAALLLAASAGAGGAAACWVGERPDMVWSGCESRGLRGDGGRLGCAWQQWPVVFVWWSVR